MPVLNQGGQFATSTQARNLEVKHLKLFSDLVDAWDKVHLAKRDIDNNGAASIFKKDLNNKHIKKLIPLTGKWTQRQWKYEKIPNGKASIFEFPIRTGDWLNPQKFLYIKQVRDNMNAERTGVWDSRSQLNARTGCVCDQKIGFIPLIIWAVVAIAAAFTADSIVDELNTTTEEQAELTTVTNNFCTDNQLTPEQCQALLQQQTEATNDDGGIPWIKISLLAGGGWLAYNWLAPKVKSYAEKRKSAA